MEYKLKELLDVTRLRELLDALDELHSMPSAIIDTEGNILTATAWQDICTKFHRVNSATEKICIESDRHIEARLGERQLHVIYKCPMGLVDSAMPIIIEGKHLGNVFTGQLFMEAPDEAYFINQARTYGFDEAEYLEAMRKVPLFSEEKLHKNLNFIHSITQMLAEQGLQFIRQRKSEESLREAHNLARIGQWDLNFVTNKLTWSDNIYELLEIGRGDVTPSYEALFQFVHPDDRDKLDQAFRASVDNNKTYELEHRLLMKDGRIKWINEIGRTEYDESGNPIRSFGTTQDITERKWAEQAQLLLQETLQKQNAQLLATEEKLKAQILEFEISQTLLKKSEEKFAALLDNTKIQLWAFDGISYTYTNKEWFDFTGQTSDSPLTIERWASVVHPDDAEKSGEVWLKNWETKTEHDNYFRLKRHDGIYRDFYCHAVPITDEHGVFKYFQGFNFDITERKLAQEKIRESEENYRKLASEQQIILNSSSVGIVFVKNRKVIWANPAHCKIFGYEVGATQNMDIAEYYVDKKSYENVVGNGYATIASGGIFSDDLTMKKKDGSLIWCHLVGQAINSDNMEEGSIWSVLDMTENRQVETYKEIKREILQILNEPGNMQDLIERVLTELKELTGFDAIGVRVQDGDDFTYFAQKGFSKDFLLKENSLLKRTVDGGICRDEEGNICLECTCGLVVSEKTDPANSFFTKGGSFWTNDSFPILNIPSDEDPRFSPRNECIHEEYASIALVPIRYKGRVAGLIQFNDRHKGRLTLNLVEIFEGIASDIGATLWRKQVEEEKAELEKQFQQAQKLESLGVLAGGIAHDFNNILTVILGHCYMAREDFIQEAEYKEIFLKIETAGNRAADLCRQMLTYAGKNPMAQTRVNLWMLIDEVVKMLKAAIKKNIAIELDLKRDVPEINGDTAQIQQIIMNLIINSADAIGEAKGTIRVKLSKAVFEGDRTAKDTFGTFIKSGSYACLEVVDTGSGMDEATMKRIFEPFFTTKFTGRGLGMSAIQGIIKSHEGNLQLASTPGVGTTFKIFFPLPAESDNAETTATSVSITEKTSGTILLVEDEETLRIMGESLLEAMGFSAMTASNGCEALEVFRERGSEVDVILMDLIMPVMGGIEAYHELRKINPTVPIIICSGYGVESVEVVIGNDPHAGFVHKPYKPNELRDEMVRMIG